MSDKYSPAQRQDVFYSIGGGSLSMDMETRELFDGWQVPEVFIVEDRSIPDMGAVFVPFPHWIAEVPRKWYQRLWTILNMDLRDLWRTLTRG
jgi:hypothetical protein